MAAPVFVASSATSSLSAISVSWPTHQADDIGLLIIESSNETITFTTTASFSTVSSSPQGIGTAAAGDSTRLSVYWSRATGNSMQPPVIADPGDHIIGVIATFRGCETSGLPWDIIAGDTEGTPTSQATVPGATTSADSCLVVTLLTTGRDVTGAQITNWTNGSLAGVAEIFDLWTGAGNGGTIGAATGEKLAAGAYSSTTATIGGSTNAVQGRMSIALKPPAPAPPVASVAPLGRQFRLPSIPSNLTGQLATVLRLWERQLNSEAFISKFSAANPNTSGLTGIPGNLAMNVGSASTWTRLWVMGGSVASIDTNGWQMVRVS